MPGQVDPYRAIPQAHSSKVAIPAPERHFTIPHQVGESSPKRPRLKYEQSFDGLRSGNVGWSRESEGRRYSHTGSMHTPIDGQTRAPPMGYHAAGQMISPQEHHRHQWENPTVQSPVSCEQCSKLGPIVEQVISNVLQLDDKLRQRLTPSVVGLSLPAPDIGRAGLLYSLEWVVETLRNNIGYAHQLASGPSHPNIHADAGHAYQQGFMSPRAVDQMKRKIESLERDRDETTRQSRPRHLDDHAWTPVSEVRPPFSADGERRMSFMSDSRMTTQSPHAPISVSGSTYTQSPVQAGPGPRTLPTPSSLNLGSTTTTALPSISPSAQSQAPPSVPPAVPPSAPPSVPPTVPVSAQAAHFQDLQHQVSTKTLALQTLQREHDDLLHAFSRSQSRCSSLEKKLHVSDVEINKLSDERMEIQAQLEAMESSVDELVKSRDEARTQSVANGGQWMTIMARASQLEQQGVEERKRLIAEKEGAERERDELARRIERLERSYASLQAGPSELAAGSTVSRPGSRGPTSSQPLHLDSIHSNSAPASPPLSPTEAQDIVQSTSTMELRAEISRLRRACTRMESALRELKTDGSRMGEMLQTLGETGKRMVGRADVAISGMRRRSTTSSDKSSADSAADKEIPRVSSPADPADVELPAPTVRQEFSNPG
ncbi:MAG: hypothetical protein M1825_001255 [Sarcosagium campestre]|nr:MAG: hypothetical protein M1825_001255 [Sarcosagium campestre]